MRVSTQHDATSNKGYVKLEYYDGSAWIDLGRLRVWLKQSGGAALREITASSRGPEVFNYFSRNRERQRLRLKYPATTTDLIEGSVLIEMRRGKPGIKVWAKVDSITPCTDCEYQIDLTPTNFRYWTRNGTERDATAVNEVTESPLTSGSSTTDGVSFTTASVTPTATRLVLLTVVNSKASAPDEPDSITGNGLTWVKVAGTTYNTIASPTQRITVYRAMGPAPTAGTIVIHFPGTETGCAWSVVEFGNVDTSGTSGSGAVVQAVVGNIDSATSLTVTLAAFRNSNNATFGGFGIGSNVTATVGSGFAAIHDVTYITPSTGLHTQWKATNDTTVDASHASPQAWGGVAVEINTDVQAGDTDIDNVAWVQTTSGAPAAASVLCVFARMKKVDCDHIGVDVGDHWSSFSERFDTVTVKSGYGFEGVWISAGRYDKIGWRTASQLGSEARGRTRPHQTIIPRL